MATNNDIRVIELRNYLIKPHTRDRFINYFKQHFTDSQEVMNGYVLSQFRIKGQDDRFFWIRGFNNMQARSVFLPAFYGGPVWKEFGPEANEMMLEWHNVHLLRPLKGTVGTDSFSKQAGLVVIDYYTVKEGQLERLVDFFESSYLPFLKASGIDAPSLWVSEMKENDFPGLPVIQSQNNLVTITSFEDEASYKLKSEQTFFNSFGAKNPLLELLESKETLILYPA